MKHDALPPDIQLVIEKLRAGCRITGVIPDFDARATHYVFSDGTELKIAHASMVEASDEQLAEIQTAVRELERQIFRGEQEPPAA